MAETRILRTKQLLELVPFSRVTLWRKVKAGKFPKPLRLGGRMVAWRSDEVQQWIDALPTEPDRPTTAA